MNIPDRTRKPATFRQGIFSREAWFAFTVSPIWKNFYSESWPKFMALTLATNRLMNSFPRKQGRESYFLEVVP